MQEVRGSNPLSSTQLRQINRKPEPTVKGPGTAAKYSSAAARWPCPRPGSGSGRGRSCWHHLLKPPAKTDLERSDQEERSFPRSFDTCAGAIVWRGLAGDSCRQCNRSGQPVRPVSMPISGLSRWRSMRPVCARRMSARRQGASAARRGAIRRVWVTPVQRRARGGAPGWWRQARRSVVR
jgi:hypothetical protein